MNLIDIASLRPADVYRIWSLVHTPPLPLHSPQGTVAWSFEGQGLRTRTTFIQAFQQLGLPFVELPTLLHTAERACDLAGYLDPFYALYVVRTTDHARLAAFAAASRRPVINAMTALGHPCEVLTDAYYLHTQYRPITQAHVGLWGPTTNVLRSWQELAQVLGFRLTQICHPQLHEAVPGVAFTHADALPPQLDMLLTDRWPNSANADLATALTPTHLNRMGRPALLPTPPFSVGGELALDPLDYAGFVGYQQKALLLPVQAAIIRWALEATPLQV